MKRKRNILLFILIISSLGLILFPKSVIGSIADIHYTFENDIVYSNDNIDYYDDSFNLKDTITYTQDYYGIYSFSNDTDYSNPSDFTIDESGGSINVFPLLDGHNKVMELNDTDGANSVEAYNTFSSAQSSGTIELWFRITDASKVNYIYLLDGATEVLALYTILNSIAYFDGVQHIIVAIDDNAWYHIRIDFECGAGAYEGLGADTYFVYINGIKYGAYAFWNNVIDTDIFKVWSHVVQDGMKGYYDVIDYSWDTDYSFGRNIIPIREIDTEIREVDRFEYALGNVNVLYPEFSSDPSGWTETEGGLANLHVHQGYPVVDPNDRMMTFLTNGVGSINWQRNDFTSTDNFINMTFSWLIEQSIGNTDLTMVIESSDSTQITGLFIDMTALTLSYINGGLIQLRNDLATDVNYEFNIFINYEIDRATLLYFVDGIFIEVYNYELAVNGKNGISQIEFGVSSDSNSVAMLDYVGVYSNGISLSDEYGWDFIHLGGDSWSFRNNNLFTSRVSGLTHMGVVSGSYIAEETMRNALTWKTYVNNSFFRNIYDEYVSTVSNASLVFTRQGKNLTLSSLHIEGVRLVEGSNEYFLEYDYSGIEIDISYFYVDINNKLQFNLITNDTDTEYIQATFDISDLSSTDKAISFRGSIIDKAFGYFIVDYIVGLTTVDIPIFEKTTRAILPPNKTIDNLIILITDNDIDAIIGITTGYVSEPIILNVLGIGLPILTTGLIEMMIPLLLIMIPTLLISQGFGKEGKKLLIPLFLMFSLITTATLIIPVWIFFIILFGSGLFLARNKEIEVK